MAKFLRPAVEVEAFKWTGGPDQTEDPVWFVEEIKKGNVHFGEDCFGIFMTIDSEEIGGITARPGDYIVRYNCTGRIVVENYRSFERTFERVDEQAGEFAVNSGPFKMLANAGLIG